MINNYCSFFFIFILNAQLFYTWFSWFFVWCCYVTFSAKDIYVKKSYTSDECLEDNKCGTLEDGLEYCSNYDTIIVEENPDPLTGSLVITFSVTIKSNVDGSKKELEIGEANETKSNTEDSFITIYTSCSFIIKDFVFKKGESINTPKRNIITLGYKPNNSGLESYLRLDNCEFKRITGERPEEDENLNVMLINIGEGGGDVYFYNCIINDIISYKSLICIKSFFSYNSKLNNVISFEGNIIYSNEGDVDIIDSIFENCSVKDNNGGAVYLK